MVEEKEEVPFRNSLRIKDKNKEPYLYMMKGLAVLFVLILALSTACGSDSSFSDARPNLVVSSLSGGLEVGRTSTVTIDLRNNASSAPLGSEDLPAGPGAGWPEAQSIVAELQSRDEEVEVLSGPQNAGALGPGENRSLEFTVRAKDEAGVGIHPLELALSYSYLSDVEATGDPNLPDIAFRYSEASQTIPLEAEVALGPMIEIEEVRGSVSPGGESALEIVFINQGDAPAEDLRVQLMPQEPFRCKSCAMNLSALAPGEEAHAKFSVISNNTKEGEYALPLSLSYAHAGGIRQEELAALVRVLGQSWTEFAFLPAALLLILLSLSAIGIYAYTARGGRKKRMPKRRR
jgi:hypothetical protein